MESSADDKRDIATPSTASSHTMDDPPDHATPVSRLSVSAGPSQISLRYAQPTPNDIEQISTLGRHVFAQTFAASTAPADLQRYLDEAYSLEAIKRDIQNPQKRVIVAEAPASSDAGDDKATRLAGFAMLALDSAEECLKDVDKPVELQRIYVDSSHHGGGVARKLEEEVTVWAKGEGYKHIWLGVWEDNDKAKRFYAKCGYEKIGTHDFVVGNQVDTDEIHIKSI